MEIEFFGWLTKGSCQVSLLDMLVLIIEVLVLAFIVFMIYTVGEKYGKSK